MFTPSRRVFLKRAALLASSTAAQYILPNIALAAITPAAVRRPLRMLVLGDSVMWGQGLLVDNKFSYRVGRWLCEWRNNGICNDNEDVEVHVEAHSGAIIEEEKSRDQEERRFTRNDAPVRYDGEVNYAYPTLWGQLELAKRHYTNKSIPLQEIDLIILNGGINDMSATRVFVYKIFGGDLKKKADKYCGEEMERLLGKVADTFPTARIVVPGYFPFISNETEPSVVIQTLKYLLPGNKDEKQFADKLMERMLDQQPSEAANSTEARANIILRGLARRSDEWVRVSNEALARAVRKFNEKRTSLPPANNGSSPPPEASLRAHFAPVIFEAKNAYGASDSFVWQLTRRDKEIECVDWGLLQNVIAGDQLQTRRPCLCDQAGKRNDIACVRAGTFHPNTKGADAYYKAIKSKLEPIVEFTGWKPAT